MSRPQRKPCTCGGEVTANPDDPTPGVREHLVTTIHRSWSLRTSWAPPREAPDSTARQSGDLSRIPRRVRPVRRHPRGRLVPR